MVTLRFEADQAYQRQAIDSVVELFAGQESAPGTTLGRLGGPPELGEVVFGNSLDLDPGTLERNLRRVQDRPQVCGTGPAIPEALRRMYVPGAGGLDFSVEMETGTGKTYVFLRTMAELHRRYGFAKFIVVVPSVAVREGVLSALRQVCAHLREIYDGLQFDHAVWTPRKPTAVRQFATAAHLQILVLSIDSFSTESNILNRVDPDQLGGYAPIELLRACRPIVVLDEPQNLETPVRRAAIEALAPLFRLRYSATHRDPRHLVHRLTPVEAHDLGLVKRIGVVSVTREDDPAQTLVELLRVNAGPRGVTATARINQIDPINRIGERRAAPRRVTLRRGDDLLRLSGGDHRYRGWVVTDIHAGTAAGPGVLRFGNGHQCEESSGSAGLDEHHRLMIRQAVLAHFETELRLARKLRAGLLPAPIKPLTLIFIDRVVHYHPVGSKFRRWFTEAYAELRADTRFRSLELPEVAEVHDGYFATSATGVPQDLRPGRDTRAAEAAFERIMRNKEKLLGHDEPLRFIFSHSALVEGWDNPNVFTICNLQDARSVLRKRQQIGRGLRLPVMANGQRCRSAEINLLTVIAHESFAAFATGLQREIEEETGAVFAGRITDLTKKPAPSPLDRTRHDPDFAAIWQCIVTATHYDLQFDTAAVLERAVALINADGSLEPPRFQISSSRLVVGSAGVTIGATENTTSPVTMGGAAPFDPVGQLCSRVPLSRASVVRLLRVLDLDRAALHPTRFLERAESAITAALTAQLSGGIDYRPTGPQVWTATLAGSWTVPEMAASGTDGWIRLPADFAVLTPLGRYTPTRAYLQDTAAGVVVRLAGDPPRFT